MAHMGNYADPVTGIHGAVAALAALEHRRKTGEGQWIDVAMTEATMGFFAEALIDYQLTGNLHERSGNRDPRYSPQGAYRSAGIDNWLALTVKSDDEWPALARIIGRDDLAEDASLSTLEGRQARADEIDDAISAWSIGREQYEAAWELQDAGIAAAPVLANWQMLADGHIFDRQFYKPVDHPVVGVYPFPSWPWQFSRTPASIRRAAPKFGEHNEEILREAGHDSDQIAALYASGVTASEPVIG
jgi:crotonobetainyl-CoA:carnitine CoA-transferase CaiB-like acyl-CoA transferase